MTDDIIKYLSLITIGVFILGYVDLFYYYNSFGINILSYISSYEMLYDLLPLTVGLFSFSYLIANKMFYKQSDQANTPAIDQKLSSRKKRYGFILAGLVLIGGIQIVTSLSSKEFYLKPILITSCYGISAWSLFEGFLGGALKKGEFKLSHLFIVYMFIGGVLIQYENSKAKMIKSLGVGERYSFSWRGKILKSDSAFFPIGETQSYFFFYSKRDSSTYIYKRADVDSLIIRPRS